MTSILEGQPPKKQGRNSNQNKGHLGSRSIYFFSCVVLEELNPDGDEVCWHPGKSKT